MTQTPNTPASAAEPAVELDAWLASFANLADTDQPKVHLAMRATLRILSDNGKRPEHARAMLAELDRRFPPRFVTVVQRHSFGRIMHLMNDFGHPVETGEYHAPDGTVFTIAERPEVGIDISTGKITPVEVFVDGQPEFTPQAELPEGWTWRAEYI